MPETMGHRGTYWSNLEHKNGKLKGHVWSLGKKYDVDLKTGNEPGGFAAVCLDGSIRWFADAAIDDKGQPVRLLAHIFMNGEPLHSIPICQNCKRGSESDEELDKRYDGEPRICPHCSEGAKTYEELHQAQADRALAHQEGRTDDATNHHSKVEDLTAKLRGIQEDHHAILVRQAARHRAKQLGVPDAQVLESNRAIG